MRNKIKCAVKSKNNNSENHDEKYVKIRFESDDDINFGKTLINIRCSDNYSICF